MYFLFYFQNRDFTNDFHIFTTQLHFVVINKLKTYCYLM